MLKLGMILAIESTFDETGAAVVRKRDGMVEVISNITASSLSMHEKYGGVVPEVAAREQIKVIGVTIGEALDKAGIEVGDLDAIAVANGPGLIGSLLVGVETAKTLAYVHKKPLLAVNHMVAHVFANWIQSTDGDIRKPPELPAVGLVVSGGHTDLIYMKSVDDWEWIGGTRDDAAGECYDKCARAMGLPYPGGPSIQNAAVDAPEYHERLPRPLINEETYDMSFSGLKSAVIREFSTLTDKKSEVELQKLVPSLAREVNEAIVESLVSKTIRAVEAKDPKCVLLAGGVAANALLRDNLKSRCEQLGVDLYVPEIRYCTDNAAMIGAAALLRTQSLETGVENVFGLRPDPSLGVV